MDLCNTRPHLIIIVVSQLSALMFHQHLPILLLRDLRRGNRPRSLQRTHWCILEQNVLNVNESNVNKNITQVDLLLSEYQSKICNWYLQTD